MDSASIKRHSNLERFSKEELIRLIDDRIKCRCLSCYPDVADPTCCCKWEFTVSET